MDWLETLSHGVVLLSILCAAAVAVDLLRHPQRMWIMDLAWPLTRLYAGPLGLWAYVVIGRRHGGPSQEKPFWQVALTDSAHCGAGCAVGDVLGE